MPAQTHNDNDKVYVLLMMGCRLQQELVQCNETKEMRAGANNKPAGKEEEFRKFLHSCMY
jgi:hypothetical protein